MDGRNYPARLVNLPCVVETQKTLDKSTFFKSGDVGQMLIVYKDEASYKRDEAHSLTHPRDFYPDGITPPTKNIVRRRFMKARPDHGKFDRAEVIRVESQVLKMKQDPSDASDKTKKGIGSSSQDTRTSTEPSASASTTSARGRDRRGTTSTGTKKGSEDGNDGDQGMTYEHEEIVPFEPWMVDAEVAAVGRLEGITIEITGSTAKADASDPSSRLSTPSATHAPRLFGHELLYQHPEILLSKEDIPRESARPPVPAPTALPQAVMPTNVRPVGGGKKLNLDTSAARRGDSEVARAETAADVSAPVTSAGAATIVAASAAISAAPGAVATAVTASGVPKPGQAGDGDTGDLSADADMESVVMNDADLMEIVPFDIFSDLPSDHVIEGAPWRNR